jgi:hypothetical protein
VKRVDGEEDEGGVGGVRVREETRPSMVEVEVMKEGGEMRVIP